MYRKDERRRKTREHQVSHLIVAPVVTRIAPAHREDCIEILTEVIHALSECTGAFVGILFQALHRTIAKHTQIGDHPHVPEEHRDRTVGGNRKNVPLQWRAELWPNSVTVGNRKKPPSKPDTADMEERENTRTDHGENSHRLSGTVNRSPPPLLKQAEHGRNQRSGVTDTNPENEIHNRPTPVDRIGQSPDTHTGTDQPEQANPSKGCGHERNCHTNPPPCGRLCLDYAADFIRYPVKITVVCDEGLFMELGRLHFGQQSGLSRIQ